MYYTYLHSTRLRFVRFDDVRVDRAATMNVAEKIVAMRRRYAGRKKQQHKYYIREQTRSGRTDTHLFAC